MDIQVSSNFERLLFEAADRDGDAVRQMMDGFVQSQGFAIPADALVAIRKDFEAGTTSQSDVTETIANCLKHAGYLADPHTAVAIAVARQKIEKNVPMVTLSTAHPAKFSDAVKAATKVDPPMPWRLQGLDDKPERMEIMENDQQVVESYIADHTRASEE
jgi:threonine synthase